MSRFVFRCVAVIVALCLAAACLGGCSGGAEEYSAAGFAMGSSVGIDIRSDDTEKAKKTADDILAAINKLDSRISANITSSDVARINRAEVGMLASEETRDLINSCLNVCVVTSGAFDITTGALSRLWDIESEDPRVPTDEEIAEALKLTDWHEIDIDNARGLVLKGEGQILDLGAIGKGAGCDAAFRVLGSTSFGATVSVGGSVLCYGRPKKGGAWKIGVRDPDGGLNDLAATMSLEPAEKSNAVFVSTSGSYEKYFELDGVRYHHIFDPSTGRPADSGLKAVTVVSKNSGALSDAFSTAFFVMGVEDSLPIIRAYGLEALFFTSDGRIIATPGLYGKVKLSRGTSWTLEKIDTAAPVSDAAD